MNLFELAESLPNGLHDAELLRLAIDYKERTVVFDLEIWVGDLDGPDDQRESYRPARITLTAFVYFSIEPPDLSYPFQESGAITIDLSAPESTFVPDADQTSEFRLFVSEWNAFIHASAPEVRLEWYADAANRNS